MVVVVVVVLVVLVVFVVVCVLSGLFRRTALSVLQPVFGLVFGILAERLLVGCESLLALLAMIAVAVRASPLYATQPNVGISAHTHTY